MPSSVLAWFLSISSVLGNLPTKLSFLSKSGLQWRTRKRIKISSKRLIPNNGECFFYVLWRCAAFLTVS